MSNRKTSGYLFHSYIKAKSTTITADKSILERAILVESSSKAITRSCSGTQKKKERPCLAKKIY